MTRSDLPLDGSDLLAAPGMFVTNAGAYYWRAPRADITAGHSKDAIRLPGRAGDGQDLIRAARCRELESGLLRWRSDQEGPKVTPYSWRWIIARYMADEYSPFNEVKANTRKGYRETCLYLKDLMGDLLITNTDFTQLKRLQKAMLDKYGRAFVHRKFTQIRSVVSYGVKIEPKLFADLKAILSEMRIPKTAPRTVAPTKDQIEAIIAAADRAGDSMFALAISLQWWLTLRAVDVRGQFLGEGTERRWADGLTWNMIDRDLGAIRKVVSKTVESEPDEMVWSLADLPDIRARLQATIPVSGRIGPVILQPNGQPYDRTWFSAKFRRYRKAAGVPDTVKMMDTRAGAITHAKSLGASKIQMQHAAGHANANTTERYIRDRSAEVAEVIQLRMKK